MRWEKINFFLQLDSHRLSNCILQQQVCKLAVANGQFISIQIGQLVTDQLYTVIYQSFVIGSLLSFQLHLR
jgi:hypothetical protein